MADLKIHRAEDCTAAGTRTHLAEDCFSNGPWPPKPAVSASSLDTCAAKLGEPYHMHLCGRPAIYLTAQEAEDSGRGVYSGWRHVKPADDEDHGAVPKRALGL